MKSILLVDDFQSNLLLIKNILSEDYNVTTATSGEQAMKILRTKHIDLLVLDIWMPGLDGLDTLQMIRENCKIKDVPVILLTGQADMNNILRGHKLGVMDVLAKPVLPDLMKERIHKALMNVEAEREKREETSAEELEKGKKNKYTFEKSQEKQKPKEKKALLIDEEQREETQNKVRKDTHGGNADKDMGEMPKKVQDDKIRPVTNRIDNSIKE